MPPDYHIGVSSFLTTSSIAAATLETFLRFTGHDSKYRTKENELRVGLLTT